MPHLKIYGLSSSLVAKRSVLSDAIHAAVVQALNYPLEKRFHRFISLKPEEFFYPADRSENYTIIEIQMFAGRSPAAKKSLIRQLYTSIQAATGIQPQDIEIAIIEIPPANWGIRGVPGDELHLDYSVE